jgi:hypothetical protein
VTRKDYFYKEIPFELLGEYNKTILSGSKRFMKADLGEKTPLEVEEQYVSSYRKFYDNILENEMVRS